MADAYKKATDQIKGASSGTTSSVNAHSDAVGRLRSEHGKFVPESVRSSESIRATGASASTASGSFLSMASAVKTAAGAWVAWKALDTVKDMVGLGVSTSATMEQMRIAFGTMMKDQQRVGAEMKWLSDTAAQTPFEMPSLTKADRILMGFGMNVDKTRHDFIIAMGDMGSALGVTSEQMPEFARVFGQIHAAGRLYTQDMNQLVNYGVEYNKVAGELGMSVSEMRKAMEKGKISTQQFEDAIARLVKKNYAGGMADQAKSFYGKMSSVKDYVALSLGRMMDPILPYVGDALLALSKAFYDFAQSVPQKIESAIQAVKGLAASIQRTFANPEVRAYIAGLGEDFRKFYDVYLSGPVAAARKLLGEFVGYVVSQFPAMKSNASDALGGIRDGFKWILDHGDELKAMMVGITTAFVVFKTALAISSAINLLTSGWLLLTVALKVATAWQWLMNTAMLANPVIAVVAAIAALVAGLVYFFTQTETGQKIWTNFTRVLGEAWQWVVAKFVAGKDWIVAKFNEMVAWFQALPGNVSRWFSSTWESIKAFFSNLFSPQSFYTAGKAIHDFVLGAIQKFEEFKQFAVQKLIEFGTMALVFFLNLPSLISGAVIAFGSWLLTQFQSFRTWVITTVLELAPRILEFFINLPGTLLGALVAFKIWIGERFQEAMTWAVTTITEAGPKILKWFEDLPGNIGNALSSLVDTITKPFKDAFGWVEERWSSFWAGLTGNEPPKAAGDTATSHARGRGGIGNTLAQYRAISSGMGAYPGISNIWVGGGGRGRGSGDHQAGRALDLVGPSSYLNRFQKDARALGAFAEFHGTGGNRHLHYVASPARSMVSSTSASLVPGGMGDTRSSVMASGGDVYNLTIYTTGDNVVPQIEAWVRRQKQLADERS